MQSIITCLLAFVISAIAGKLIIPALRALHIGQSIREVGPTWHNEKQGTPTMGGVIFMLGCLVCIITGWDAMLEGDYNASFALWFFSCFWRNRIFR